MLNQRQLEILLEFCNHTDELLTASYFADKLNVSLRTIQGDMRLIKKELDEESSIELISKSSKGSCIKVNDHDEFSAFVNSLYQQYTMGSLNYPTSRLNQILLLLLNRHRAISFYEMEEQFFVSRSTLLNDLKKIENTLSEYQLELLRSNNKVMIDGYEINKRRCLSDQNLYFVQNSEQNSLYIDERQIAKIKNVLTEVFVEFKYHIMDNDFSNTILLLNVMISRMMDGFYIQSNELDITENLGIAYDISKSFFDKISKKLLLKVVDEEILFFAIYLNGQGNNHDSDTITTEMSDFILDSLEHIKDHFGVNFVDNINLRITLALHCMSLQIRVKYDMQMKNDALDYIRESFPLGYDIGMYFAFLFHQKYGKKVTEYEVSLLAVHFYSGLLEINNRGGSLKILVITSLKNSMTLLLRQTLLRWFSEYIACIDFINAMDMTPEVLDNYDVFLTSEKDEFFEKGIAMYIDPFPNQQDYLNIKLYIDGFKGIDDVIQIFRPELFTRVNNAKKEEVLNIVCKNATKFYHLQDLSTMVLQREGIGSTFFSKQIAVPHPMHSVSSDTFISVCVSKKPIIWDEEKNEVNLIMLLHVGKNNTKAFQLWDYVSKIFADKMLVEKLLESCDYNNFIALTKKALEKGINNENM